MPSAAAIKKAAYAKRVGELLDNYDTALLVGADNVGSKQFMDIRAVRCLLYTSDAADEEEV